MSRDTEELFRRTRHGSRCTTSMDIPSTEAAATNSSWMIRHGDVQECRVAECSFPIIVHCHLRWDFVWQRPQQIFSRLAKTHPVLFLEEPAAGHDRATLEITEPYPGVVRVIPRLPRSNNESRVPDLLKRALHTHPLLAGRFDAAVHWFYSPMSAPHFLGQIGTLGVVYDCMDELANFRFAPSDIGTREQLLIDHADIVFTGGHELFLAKSKRHQNVRFYGCGVDVQHFGKARLRSTAISGAVAVLQRPVFGYFGVIDERLDYQLIADLADRFPDGSIVMAGPLAKIDASQIPQRANIHWLGQRDYQELPALVKGFDVCLMPFALNEATRYINPTKTLEYMAAGKPVVSTAVADVVSNFTPVVAIAQSGPEFLQRVGHAWKHPDPALIRRGLARAERASWESIVASMERDVRNVLYPQRMPAQARRGNFFGVEQFE